jgi:hypothetical protein
MIETMVMMMTNIDGQEKMPMSFIIKLEKSIFQPWVMNMNEWLSIGLRSTNVIFGSEKHIFHLTKGDMMGISQIRALVQL